MPYIERTDEEIIEAWKRWAGRVPNPDEKTMGTLRERVSAREMVQLLEDKESWAFKTNVVVFREMAEADKDDPVRMIDEMGEQVLSV